MCLEAGECWPGCYSATVYTSLFLDFFHQLFFQWHQRHSPLFLHLYLFLWKTFLLPLFLYLLWRASCMMACEHEPCTCKLALKVPHATITRPNMTVSMTPHVLEWAMHPARLAMEVKRVHSLEIHTGRTMTNVDSAHLSGKQHFPHCAHYAADNSAGHSQKCCQKKLDL